MGLGALAVMQQRMTGEQLSKYLCLVHFNHPPIYLQPPRPHLLSSHAAIHLSALITPPVTNRTHSQTASFLFYVNFISAACGDVGDRFSSIQEAIGSTTAVFSLMDRSPRLKVREDLRAQAEQQQQQQQEEQPAPPKLGRVSFRNVTFAYPLRDTRPVLHGVDLEIRPGERTAIVGGACVYVCRWMDNGCVGRYAWAAVVVALWLCAYWPLPA